MVASIGRIYSIACPACSAPAVHALVSDPSCPVYACGSYGRRIVCRREIVDDGPNVQPFTDQDARDYASIIRIATTAWAPVTASGVSSIAAALLPQITLCESPGCDATAIDGACLDHA